MADKTGDKNSKDPKKGEMPLMAVPVQLRLFDILAGQQSDDQSCAHDITDKMKGCKAGEDDKCSKGSEEKQVRIDLNPRKNPDDPNAPFGLKRGYISRLDYETIRDIFYGINQMDVPDAMLSAMNPTEIFALYCGLYSVKTGRLKIGKSMHADGLVSKIISYSFGKHSDLAHEHNASKKIYPTGRGDLQKRIRALDRNVTDNFLRGLAQPRKYSDRENKEVNDFEDPNIDGRSKISYYKRIIHYFK